MTIYDILLINHIMEDLHITTNDDYPELSDRLLAAVKANDVTTAQQLIQDGANINIKDKMRLSLLHHAVNNDNLPMVDLLVKAGIALNDEDIYRCTPLQLAVGRSLPITEYLVRSGVAVFQPNEQSTLLHEAASANQVAIVEFLVDAGIPIDSLDYMNRTPLQQAIRYDRYEAVQWLLDHGADVNHRDREGSTALIMAAKKRNKDLIKLLLDYGADKYITNNDRQSACFVAQYRITHRGMNGGTILNDGPELSDFIWDY